MSMPNYHIPVLFFEVLEHLAIKSDGVYVDLTLGGGGHAKGILEKLGPKGKLVVFDQDPDAWDNAPKDDRVVLVKQNFRHLKKYLKFYGVKQIDGVLADLGVSSHQFDEASRGFSFRYDAELDMRMNPQKELSAKTVLADYSEGDLKDIFKKYGEIRQSHLLARKIVAQRTEQPINTTRELVALVESVFGKRKTDASLLAQVFQALRIEVNEELKVLEEFLESLPEILSPEGRAVIISYHSLEDRLVKNFFKSGSLSGDQEKDFYGNLIRPLKPLTTKPIVPTPEEMQRNSRATSAKMRVAEKIEQSKQ
ncbi:16S rRNA (cytosine(1402)-N(4))-methyltransferase RsmH [Luteibaculum oceani]|uniref:Ribosomal RNA small subunit methyltransferase H n=1 Tax=Luteibaculum oceani TaxID=1294296 RepID=A0A5C6V2L6_9FLAO|nr:16S rRNA (cytosine(1402)-N(4))-methyltransferase RsmH [Luteibaculum oceani]TXC78881.1 16S rRNA (cytosine(1402)-N(4))-methyltransferase RsmH [Luteibaculum oceani]